MKRCRSLLFMPGNNPGMLGNAASLGADAVIFDLEDAVALREKDAARILVHNALKKLPKNQATSVIVRINALDTPQWKADVDAVVEAGTEGILLPKASTPDDIRTLAAAVEAAEKRRAPGLPEVYLIGLVETALGIESAYEIAKSHPRLKALQLGAEDLTLELGAKRTPKGDEVLYSRMRLIIACRAARIMALDTPYPFVTDLEGLAADTAFAAQLGFDGKTVISPHHVSVINGAFTPAADQIAWSKRVIAAALQAEKEGKGAVSLDGMMIDLPIIKRAENLLSRAGLLDTATEANGGAGHA